MTILHQNPWFRVVRENQYHYIEEYSARNGAVVLVKPPNGFLFVEVYRPANGGTFIEAPRGYGEKGESAWQCAVRELREETGIEVTESQLSELGQVQPNSAILASTVSVFLAQIEDFSGVSNLDGEASSLVSITEAELPTALSVGRITDGFTLAAMALFWSKQRTEAG